MNFKLRSQTILRRMKENFFVLTHVIALFFFQIKNMTFTSGSLIDAVRIGCYCIMPKPSKMAQELIGPLIIKDLVNRNEYPKLIINSMIEERKKLNYLQIDRMISS